ncbi:5'-nucleotidase C-terminal domain-containing protein [Thioclava atlantica]|uniref:Bifunctional 2',3'-cyclic nucleotide 2'-phosphodiesterase/3'-nucleotidase periplasmic protein n=1 Tax=Thioclava atlantica TaxID=1317124 RepID=A0A085TYT9_9RHOB|nr:5'-nucleotidase C-terminal domain-containing protein [Thioclava atlantica]KFE35886.1 bifunctional 2',3'-cyclic nucleotide 2'-phosphodiesterase/3'-nucleotidase periplasmic precursor protein [Thioclava atlantica]
MGYLPDRLGAGQHIELEPTQVTLALRLIETTDLHGQVRSYDYFNDRPAPCTGLAALAPEIARARDEASNSLLFDCGDFLQGTPMTQIWGEAEPHVEGIANPMIAVMNAVGYDAAALGNHEFDFGTARLEQARNEARFPFLGANLAARGGSEGNLPKGIAPWVLLERDMTDDAGRTHRLRIAVIGFLPPPIPPLPQMPPNAGLHTTCLLDAASDHMPDIRRAMPDLVIALAHTGIAPILGQDISHASQPARLGPQGLAQIDGIDVILFGHDHRTFPAPQQTGDGGIDPHASTLHGKPAINAGTGGTHIGVLDLSLEKRDGRWSIRNHAANLRQAGDVRDCECPAILELSADAHTRTLTHIRREIGVSLHPLHSYFATLGPDPTLALIARAKLRHARDCLVDRPERHLPMIAAVSAFKAGGLGGPGNYVDIPAGKLRANHLDDLYLYNNAIGAVEISGTELRDWLELAASVFQRQLPGGTGAKLLDPTFASYQFDVFPGLTYEIDLSAPARYDSTGRLMASGTGRIRDLHHAGRKIADEERFVVLSSDFRLAGGGGFRPRGRPVSLTREPAPIRDLLLAEIQRPHADPAPAARPVWRFAPIPGARVICQTGPGAVSHLSDLRRAGMSVTPLPLDDEGFLPLEIAL